MLNCNSCLSGFGALAAVSLADLVESSVRDLSKGDSLECLDVLCLCLVLSGTESAQGLLSAWTLETLELRHLWAGELDLLSCGEAWQGLSTCNYSDNTIFLSLC